MVHYLFILCIAIYYCPVLAGLKKRREKLPVYINEVNVADLLLDVCIIFNTIISRLLIVINYHSIFFYIVIRYIYIQVAHSLYKKYWYSIGTDVAVKSSKTKNKTQ